MDAYQIIWTLEVLQLNPFELDQRFGGLSNENMERMNYAFSDIQDMARRSPELFTLCSRLERTVESALYHPDNYYDEANAVIDLVK